MDVVNIKVSPMLKCHTEKSTYYAASVILSDIHFITK